MICNEVQPLLTDFADNTLDNETRKAIQAHLDGCAQCSKEWLETSQLLAAIRHTPVTVPGAAVRQQFNAMLQAEIANQPAEIPTIPSTTGGSLYVRMRPLLWRVAAACVLLATGVFAGIEIGRNQGNGAAVTGLQKQMKEMQEKMMVNMLDDESASQRLQAVSYVDSIKNPNKNVTDALIHTLNNDKNVNVRLASLYSLAKFSALPAVSDSLVASLSRQTEPIIQVVLINILVEKKESRAVGPIRQLLKSDKTLKEVKEAAQKGLKAI